MIRAPKFAATPREGSDPDAQGLARLRQDRPLVPGASIAGRALVTVIAIMTFLAALTAGAALLIAGASDGWREQVSREITIQVRPVPGRDLEVEAKKAGDIARAAPGVAAVRVFTKEESARLLEPWLGTGLDMAELPVPRMIVVTRQPGVSPDLDGLRKALAAVPASSLDDHHLWLERLAAMARSVETGAALIFGLMLAAMALAVSFATHGAMAENREIIDVLHFVGARDSYVAKEFQRHFLRLGLAGGGIGAVAGCLVFASSGIAGRWWTATPGGDQMEALFGSFSLGWAGYAAILAIAGGVALLTGLTSRAIVYRHLRGLY